MWLRSLMGAGLLLVLVGCATTPASAPVASAAAKKPPVGCVSDTATRLPVPPNGCAGFGSTYTKGDLDRTGQVYAQDALHTLDPNITVRGP
jgi:hypothetical protein